MGPLRSASLDRLRWASGPRAAPVGRAAMLIGVDVGGTFTDAVLAFDGRLITAKAPTTPDDQSEGVMAAIQAALERPARTLRNQRVLARHDRRHERPARGPWGEDGVRRDRGLHRPDRPRPTGPPAALPAVRGPTAPLAPDELRFGASERMTPDGPPTSSPRAASGWPPGLQSRARGSRGHASPLLPPPRARAVDRRALAGSSRTDTCRSRMRSSARSASTSAPPPPRSTPPCLRCSRATCAGSSQRTEESALARAGDHAVQRRPDRRRGCRRSRLLDRALRASRRSGGRRLRRARCRDENALCLDMGGTSCDVCVVDDGAVQERSSGEIAGRPLALPMLAVHTVGAGGGSIAWRDAGGALRVGPQSAGRRPRAGVLRARRHGTDGHRRQPRARLPVLERAPRRRRRARPRRGRTSGGQPCRTTRPRGRRLCRGDPARGRRRDDPRAARGHRPARHRPTPVRADGVRRRRRPARGPDRRRARDRHDPVPAGVGRPGRAGLGRLATPARRSKNRPPQRARAHRRGDRAARRGARRARARRHARSRRRAQRRVRAPLPGPVVRAPDRRRRRRRRPTNCARRSRTSTRSATATATPSRSSSSSRSG